jgi:hypothetical protein
MDHIIDLLDIAAKDYPMKALAPELDKGESTLRNELTQQPGYKLGLTTAILIMQKTHNLRALDEIEGKFGRVAFRLPRPESHNMHPVMQLVANLSKEFGENMSEMANAIQDGVITEREAKKCLQENEELMKACIELKAYLQQFIKSRELL